MRHIRKSVHLILLLWSFLIMSCSKDDNICNKANDIINDAHYEVKSEESYNLEELCNLVSQTLISSNIYDDDNGDEESATLKSIIAHSNQNTPLYFKSIVINYESINPKGEPITLSGRFILQATSKESNAPLLAPKDILIDNHYTICSDSESPSNSMPLMATMSISNFLVIASDYMGYGVSRNVPHPFMSQAHTARTSIDMAKAVLHYLKDHNVELKPDYGVVNIGYSQSGAVALAVQKYIEEQKELNYLLPLKATYCGAGPYDLMCTYKYLTHIKTMIAPVFLPMTIIGLKEGHPYLMNDVSIEEYFSDEFKNAHILEMIKEKKFTTTQINKKILSAIDNPNASTILSKDALNEESRIYKTLEKAMKINDYTKGWSPKHPVYFLHSKNDEIVSIENLYNVVKGLGNDNVFWKTVNTASHVRYGYYFYLNGICNEFQRQDNTGYYKASEIDNLFQ